MYCSSKFTENFQRCQLEELEQRLTERLDLILEERQELHHRLSETESKLTEAVDKLSVAEEKILRLG